jgi:plastocyanin
MAEETITITLGSRDEKRERFYDIPYYPIKPGKIIKWSNADNIPHEIEILSQNNVTSKNLKSILKILFPLNLEKNGTYTFQSPQYHGMKGIVDVTKILKLTN